MQVIDAVKPTGADMIFLGGSVELVGLLLERIPTRFCEYKNERETLHRRTNDTEQVWMWKATLLLTRPPIPDSPHSDLVR